MWLDLNEGESGEDSSDGRKEDEEKNITEKI